MFFILKRNNLYCTLRHDNIHKTAIVFSHRHNVKYLLPVASTWSKKHAYVRTPAHANITHLPYEPFYPLNPSVST